MNNGKAKTMWLQNILFVFFLSTVGAASAANQSANGGVITPTDPNSLALASVFVTDNNGIVYLREKDGKVYWFAEHPGRGYSHVFRGKRNGKRIRGRFVSVPKYGSTKTGRMVMEVRPGGQLKRIGGSDSSHFTRMEPRAMSQIKNQLPPQAFPAFSSKAGEDYDGGYQDERGRRYYVRTLDDMVVFFVESRFKQGKRPTAAFAFFGKWVDDSRHFARGELIALPKGKRKTSGEFSLGFVQGGVLSGQSNFQHIQSTVARPMKRKMELQLFGDAVPRAYSATFQDGTLTVEGDIVVAEAGNLPAGASPALVVADAGSYWPDCEVPYDIDKASLNRSSDDSATTRDRKQDALDNIETAIGNWNRDTRILWRKRTPADKDSVLFQAKTTVCGTQRVDGREIPSRCGQSPLARSRSGGEQLITYTRPSDDVEPLPMGVFMHEMGHAVGLGHEHTRADRDDYIRVQESAIRPDSTGNFDPRGESTIELGAYDCGSIMHYGKRQFASGSADTIIPLDSSCVDIGQRLALSAGDIDAINGFCPKIINVPGVGRRGDGAGITLAQLDNDAEPEVLLMAYDDAEGQNTFKIRQCEFINGHNALDCVSSVHTVDGLGHRGSGAGIAAGKLGGIAAEDDILVAAYDTTGKVRYRICMDFRSKGTSQCSGARDVLGGQRFGARADGLGVAIGNVDGTGGNEVVIASYDDPEGQNKVKWTLGSNISGNMFLNWSPLRKVNGAGHRGSGMGVAMAERNGSPGLELMFGVLDDKSGDDPFEIITLEDLGSNGAPTGGRSDRRWAGHGFSSEGAGIAVGDVNVDGTLDLVVMSYDDPDNDDDRANQFKVRVIYSGGDG